MENTLDRSRRADPLLLDTLFAAALTALVWAQMSLPWLFFIRRNPGRVGAGPRFQPPGAFHEIVVRAPALTLGILLLAALCLLPLAFRRRCPFSVLAFVTAAAVLFERVPHPPSLTMLGPLIALYTVGTLSDRRKLTISALVVGIVLLAASLPSLASTSWLGDFVRTFAVVAFAAALGDATRNRRAYVAEVEQRAIEAERTREEEARRRVDEERIRIARDLHDIVSHSMSVIAVQSGVASHVLKTDPEAAREAIDGIHRTSREALSELRNVLGVLRTPEDVGAPVALPGLGRLPELVRTFQETGLEVATQVAEDVLPVPPLVDTSAYRIVQEALTNVVRHAGEGASATVRVSRGDGALLVEVQDNGVGAAAERTEGHGLAGMRERALALGGTFESGPGPEGGWRVAADLPLEEQS